MRLSLLVTFIALSSNAVASPQGLCGTPGPPALMPGGAPDVTFTTSNETTFAVPPPVQLPAMHPSPVQPSVVGGRVASAAPSTLPDFPILQYIASSGAVLTDLGIRNGLRSVIARNQGEFLTFWVVPSGAAAVSGFSVDLSSAQLAAIAGTGLIDLGAQHGLQALLVRNGPQFQVFYVMPDGERVIPGIMWDAAGKNLTRELVGSVEGAVPTVRLGDAQLPAARPHGAVPSLQAATTAPMRSGDRVATVERAVAGTIGNSEAPHVWMFADPQCGYSSQAVQRLQPLVAAGRLRLSVIPVAILDQQNGGRSTTASLAMLSHSGEQMIAAWSRGDQRAANPTEAARHLETNMQAAAAVGIRGTPTFFWRRAAGGEGRHDGMPSDVEAFVAAVRGG